MTPRLRRALVTVLTVVAVLLGFAGRADAAIRWKLIDNLETSATRSLWFDDEDGNTSCVKYTTCAYTTFTDRPRDARSGTYSGYMVSPSYPNAWVSFGRRVRLPSTAVSCTANVAVKVGWFSTAPDEIAIEVIQVSDMAYTTRRTYALSSPDNDVYQLFTAGEWQPAVRDVLVRVVLPGDVYVRVINFDDLTVDCVLSGLPQ